MDNLFMEILNPKPIPVSSDCLLTDKEMAAMMDFEEATLFFMASVYPHIIWN